MTTILLFCTEIHALSNPRRVLLYKMARLPFGWQYYSFVDNCMNSLNQGVFDCTKIARLLFGWQSYTILVLAKACLVYNNSAAIQSYTFIENYMNSLSQGVFDRTKIAQLLFGWQFYSFVEKYMLSFSQGVFKCTKIARITFRLQSYSSVDN